MRKKRAIIFSLVTAGLLGGALWVALNEADRTFEKPVAYIVCRDDDFQNQRVYRIDLINGGVLGVSEPIDWMGNPTQLAIDTKRSRLYVGSFRGKARDYYPMTVVNIQDGEFEVLNRFTTNPADTLPRDSTQWNEKPFEVYQIAVSPDSNELYVAHGGLSEGMLRAVWDADTGGVLRELAMSVRSADVWSPDERYVAKIWPVLDRMQEENGRTIIKETSARINLRDVRMGERVSLTYLEDGKGLHPPWGRIEGPMIHVHGKGRVRVHDRDTGEVSSEFNVHQLSGLDTLGGVTWIEPPVLDDNQTIVLSMFGYGFKRTYVVAIDVLRQTELTRTEVGVRCTNPVVRYE